LRRSSFTSLILSTWSLRRWIIRWQFEQTGTRSVCGLMIFSSDNEPNGSVWWTSINPLPLSPYTFSKSNPQTAVKGFKL
jgi:hypothetical protein